ncbi:helix-turn-helix domain-containing protein [Paenibacillus cymbidii]|uniref:helix-turn-helix domain-containing protein n=1 Tax=Paenibacillus cymbidii TaxID=1639034 RepID=UPI001081B9DF|nr:helix-turn-helix domain-containing protein [Paenibacillus cymbidii]
MRRNWFHRSLLSFLPVLVLIVCLFAFIGIVQLNDLSRKEAMKSSRVYVQNLQNSMDLYLRATEMMMIESIARNSKLTSFAGMDSDPAFIIELSQLLQSMMATSSLIDSVYIYRTGDGTIVSDKTKLPIEQFADRAFIERFIGDPKAMAGWSAPRKFRTLADAIEENQVISMAKGIPLTGKSMAMLVINVRVGAVREFFESNGKSEVNRIAVKDGSGSVLYEAAQAEPRGYDIEHVSDYTGWKYYGSLKPLGAGQLLLYVTNGWFIVGFAAMIAGIGWVIFVTRRNYRPIETMLSRIQKYNQQRSAGPVIREPSVDELGYIDRALSSMMEMTSDYEQQSRANREYRRLRLFRELAEGSRAVDAAELLPELGELGLCGFGCASAAIVEIDKYADFIGRHSRKDQGLFKYILNKVVDETAKASGLHIWQEWLTNHRLYVLYLEEEQPLHADSRLLEQADQVRAWIQNNLQLTVTFGIGTTVRDIAGISSSCETAARALDYKSALGSNRVIGHWEIELLSHDDLYIYLQYVRTIAQAFRVGSDGWLEQLGLLFAGLKRMLLPKEEIGGILNYMNYYFYREMMELPPEYQELWNRQFRDPWEQRADELETLDELESFYASQLAACARQMEAIRESKGNQAVVQKVKAYIEEHYSDPDLSLAGLSDQFHMNASSLSTLFKEEFGEKFVVYLCQIRMEHAKRLLRETTLQIQEISERIGYLHQMSFIRAFKKTVGTTPGDYRKTYQ